MRGGVPTDVKADERRVAITPSGVAAFVSRGHEVVLQTGASIGGATRDDVFRAAAMPLAARPAAVWNRCNLILNVKEPLDHKFELMHEG